MSNLIYNGLTFQNDLLASWKLQNLLSPEIGETQEMQFSLLNALGNGFELVTKTLSGSPEVFIFRHLNGSTSTDLLSYDSTSGFTFTSPVNVPTPSLGTEATNKNFVDNKTWTSSKITDFSSAVTAFRLDQFAVPTSDISLGNKKITNLATPSASTDGATMGYIDTKIFDINSSTSGNLAINRLANYPSSSSLFLRGDGTWVAPAGGGNVTGASTTTLNALAIWGNAIGTSLLNSAITVDSSGNLSLGSKKITTVQDPTNAQDASTKNYVDLFKANFRSGTVVIGDVGNTGTRTRTVTGSLTAATQSNAYTTNDSFIDITFSNSGYIPLILYSWFDPTNSSVSNDVAISVQSTTSTAARIFIEGTSTQVNNGTLQIMLVNPTM